jgi:chromosome segregation ATPase
MCLAAQIEVVKLQHQQVAFEYEKVEKDLLAAMMELETFKTANSSLLLELASSQAALNSGDDSAAVLGSMKETLASHAAEVVALELALAEKETKIHGMNATTTEMIESLTAKNHELEERILVITESADVGTRAFQTAVDNLNSDVASLNAHILVNQASYSQLAGQLNHLRDTLEATNANLFQKQEEIDCMSQEVTALTKTMAERESDLLAKDSQIESLKGQLDQQRNDFHSVQLELKDIKATVTVEHNETLSTVLAELVVVKSKLDSTLLEVQPNYIIHEFELLVLLI